MSEKNDEFENLWTRYLAGDRLDSAEEANLIEFLQSPAGAVLIEDAHMDGVLRAALLPSSDVQNRIRGVINHATKSWVAWLWSTAAALAMSVGLPWVLLVVGKVRLLSGFGALLLGVNALFAYLVIWIATKKGVKPRGRSRRIFSVSLYLVPPLVAAAATFWMPLSTHELEGKQVEHELFERKERVIAAAREFRSVLPQLVAMCGGHQREAECQKLSTAISENYFALSWQSPGLVNHIMTNQCKTSPLDANRANACKVVWELFQSLDGVYRSFEEAYLPRADAGGWSHDDQAALCQSAASLFYEGRRFSCGVAALMEDRSGVLLSPDPMGCPVVLRGSGEGKENWKKWGCPPGR